MRAHVRGTLTQVAALLAVVGIVAPGDALAQVRAGRRGGAVKTEDGGAAASRRGAAVKTEEGTAAVTRRGAAVKTEEGVKAVNRNGQVASSDDVENVAVGRRGAVVQGEEGAVAVGRRGVASVEYEDHEAWKVAAGVGAVMAIGTRLAKPPAAATPVAVQQATYLYADGVFYEKVMSGDAVSYQVIPAPAGAVIGTLPAGCTEEKAGGTAYHHCGETYYQKVSSGYQVAVPKK